MRTRLHPPAQPCRLIGAADTGRSGLAPAHIYEADQRPM